MMSSMTESQKKSDTQKIYNLSTSIDPAAF